MELCVGSVCCERTCFRSLINYVIMKMTKFGFLLLMLCKDYFILIATYIVLLFYCSATVLIYRVDVLIMLYFVTCYKTE